MAEQIRTIRVNATPQERAKNQEMARRQELRMDYLVPIYVTWTSNVPSTEAQAATQGVRDTLAASGQKRDLVIFGSQAYAANPTTPFSSPDWYTQQALQTQNLRSDVGFGPQIDVNEIMRLFYQEPYQENPHWEVFITNHDLNSKDQNGRYINFVFGSTQPTFPASVQSITRLMRETQPGNMRNEMIRRLLRHEVGHMFWLPSRDRNTEQNLGKHCTNDVCTMKQGLSIPAWTHLTQEENRRGIQFCGDCSADFARLQPRYKPLP